MAKVFNWRAFVADMAHNRYYSPNLETFIGNLRGSYGWLKDIDGHTPEWIYQNTSTRLVHEDWLTEEADTTAFDDCQWK